ncbi:helix-turn-helix transcriptional regulator [Nocardia farcinica]|uniref:helix-turn-helix transcriptional regulator n=1 Tax=Nocardia farcinica TaxID=37329 RepID=UPI001E4AF9DC|nr:hypothetical protein [Nocardia farcinica]
MTLHYIGVGDVAARLGKSRSTINGWIADRKLPPPHAQIGPKIIGWQAELIDQPDSWPTAVHNTVRYLSAPELAERIGVQRTTLNRYKLPVEDALIGDVRGWLAQTVDDWNARRPGKRVPRAQEDWNLPPALQGRR